MNGAPMQWRSGGDKARRACPGLDPGVARRDASQLAASPGMDCQPTPEPLREVAGQDARRPLHRGGLLLTPDSCPSPFGPATPFALLLQRSGYFLLATQEKVTRSSKASESSASVLAPRMRREAISTEAKGQALGPCPPMEEGQSFETWEKSIAPEVCSDRGRRSAPAMSANGRARCERMEVSPGANTTKISLSHLDPCPSFSPAAAAPPASP